MRLLLLGLISWWIFAAAGHAAPKESGVAIDRADLIRLLTELPDVSPIREDMWRLGFRGANLDLAVQQSEAFYTDRLIAGYIADRVIGVYTQPPDPADADGLIWPLIDRGLGHLPTRELHYYYVVEQTMMNALSVRECGLAVRDRLSDQRYSDAMSRVAARLNTPALREYYRIQLKAARIGVGKARAQLGSDVFQHIQARLRAELDQLIQADPDSERLHAALRNFERADNRRACQIGRMVYQAVMSLDESDLHNGLLFLSQP